MVTEDLRELLNLLNHWAMLLFSWSVWIDVLSQIEDDNDRWTLRLQTVDPIAFYCVYQPAATRDRFISVATSALHQGNLRSNISGYTDVLRADALSPGQFLRSREQRVQLAALGTHWASFGDFRIALERLNSRAYVKTTLNFRNCSSHSIAPKFEEGETNFVTRSIRPLQQLVEQPDGSSRLEEHPTRKIVSYGFGGPPPIRYSDVIEANRIEYQLAIGTLSAYQRLLEEIVVRIGQEQGRL